MSEETPKKIDERLQRYAKKRREQGGDFSLHRATRRLLQGEVARQRGQSHRRRASGWAWLGSWRGRFAFGVAAVAVLGLAAWMVVDNQQSGQPMQLAKNDFLADGEKSLREQRVMRRSGPAEEAGKQLALASAPRLSDESLDGAARRESSPSLAAPTISLTPAANSSAGAQASDFFLSANRAIPSTNRFAYDTPNGAGQNNRAIVPGIPAVQYFDTAKADQSGLAAGVQLAQRGAGAETPGSAGFDIAATGSGALGGVAANSQAKETTVNLALAEPQQTESLAFGENRPATREAVARNRQLNVNEPGAAGGARGKGVADSQAGAGAVVPAEAKAKAEVALNFSAPAAGQPRSDPSTTTRFYRQTELGQLSYVAEMEREGDALKKAAKPNAAPALLDRFTVEQQGKRLRIREPDGSVYEGLITEPALAASTDTSIALDKDALVRENAAGLKPSAAQGDGEYSFQASGSNVTLRQMIVVNGRLSAVDDLSASAAAVAAPQRPAPAQRALAPAASGLGIATNRISRMEGTVRVGTANEQQFKAVRAPR